MTLTEAMLCRHSVRRYKKEAIPAESQAALEEKIRLINEKSGLHFQFVPDHPEAFRHFLVHYGHFENLSAYVALVGKDEPDLEEKCGYYGEELVLFLQTIGLGTCWMGGTFDRKNTFFRKEPGEKMALILAVGIPLSPGQPHKSKKMERLMDAPAAPDWFLRGMDAALLAPTAINQQKFLFHLAGERRVRAIPGRGPFVRVDLGIAKYHFEIGAGRENFDWVE